MQLGGEMLPFLVLDHDQPLRQCFAFRKRRLEAAGQVVEHIATPKARKIERRQTRPRDRRQQGAQGPRGSPRSGRKASASAA